jgi:hypothetical protein
VANDVVSDEVRAGLRRIRSRRSWMSFVLFAALPIVVTCVTIKDWVGFKWGPIFDYGLLATVFGLWLATALRSTLSQCPNCAKPFFRRGLYGNGWARRCLNCGISLKSADTPQASDVALQS